MSKICETTPYDNKDGIYTNKLSPYFSKENIFLKKTNPYTPKNDSYNPLNFCPVLLLLQQSGYPLLLQDGLMIKL